MNLKLVVIGSLLAVVLLSTGTAQIQPNTDCVAARTWHLQQAMKSNLANEQDYHIGAADAANQLSTMSGTPCAGWKDWAMSRAGVSEP